MAFTSRADRKFEFALKRTDSVCGPGAYNLRKEYNTKPNYVGFSSSDCNRGIIKNSTLDESLTMPGPGQYLEREQVTKAHATNASFMSTAPRMAPVITGSSEFCTSSIVENPGPGRYDVPSLQQEQEYMKRVKLNHLSSQNAKSLSSSLSSSPTPAVKEDDNKEMISWLMFQSGRQMVNFLPQNDDYQFFNRPTSSPNRLITTTTNHPFTRSESWISKSITPGPSTYNPCSSLWKKGLTAPFKSKVKMAHQQDIPTNDCPKRAKTSELTSDKDQLAKKKSNTRTQTSATKIQSFGALAERETCPRINDRVIPFPSKAEIESATRVGPGSYNHATDFNSKIDKNTRIGFSSTSTRPCLTKSTSESSILPGPFDYNSTNHSIHNQIQKRLVGRNGVFGTTSCRFSEQVQNEILPHPSALTTITNHQKKRSKPTTRTKPKFMTGIFNKANESLISNGGPLTEKVFSYRPMMTVRDHQTRKKPKVNVPFGISSIRDASKNIDGSRINEAPGVGSYNNSHHNIIHRGKLVAPFKTTKNSSTFGTTNDRFAELNQIDNVGPGSYDIIDDWNQKTFNVTYSIPPENGVKRTYAEKKKEEEEVWETKWF